MESKARKVRRGREDLLVHLECLELLDLRDLTEDLELKEVQGRWV